MLAVSSAMQRNIISICPKYGFNESIGSTNSRSKNKFEAIRILWSITTFHDSSFTI